VVAGFGLAALLLPVLVQRVQVGAARWSRSATWARSWAMVMPSGSCSSSLLVCVEGSMMPSRRRLSALIRSGASERGEPVGRVGQALIAAPFS
jgi:hypothetical protein